MSVASGGSGSSTLGGTRSATSTRRALGVDGTAHLSPHLELASMMGRCCEDALPR